MMTWPIDPLGGLTLILEAIGWAVLALLVVVAAVAIAAEVWRQR